MEKVRVNRWVGKEREVREGEVKIENGRCEADGKNEEENGG